MSIRYGSVCSGIEAASVAWHPLGWEPVFFSEIDAFPRAVLAHHYPKVTLHGDFTQIPADAGPIDLLVGGTPCQSFSVAGLRGGLGDDRGNLALEYCRLARRLRPRWVIWENVPGVLSLDAGQAFASILGGLAECGYGLTYRVLDAQYVRVDGFAGAVPQRRERVFVVGYLGDWRPAGAVLFEPEGMRGDPAPRRKAGTGAAVSPTLRAGGNRTGGDRQPGTDVDTVESLIPFDTKQITSALNRSSPKAGDPCHPLSARAHAPAVAYGGNDTRGPIQVATALNAHGVPHGRLDFESETFVASPVAFNGRQDPDVTGDRAGSINTSSPQDQCVMTATAVRRLMPVECERLQGFPDGYTAITYRGKPAADGPRYKALGNSFAVNVVRWIGRRIEMFEQVRGCHG